MKSLSNLFRPLLAVVLMTVMVLLNSCSSKKDKLLENVPYDADVIATADLLKLAKDADISITDNSIVLPDQYTWIRKSIPAEALAKAGQLASCIDLEYIAAFGYVNKDQAYAVAALKDAAGLRSLLLDLGFKASSEKGFEIYSTSDRDYAECIAVSTEKDLVWMVPQRRLLGEVSAFMIGADNSVIKRLSDIAAQLTENNIVNIIVDPGAFLPEAAGGRVRLNLNIVDNAIVAKAVGLSNDGAPVSYQGLQTIDTDFLRYIPSNFVAAMAVGVAPDSEMLKMITKVIAANSRNRGFANEISPYIEAIDGTMAFGFGPRDLNSLLTMNDQRMQAVAMVHMKQQKVNELIQLINSNVINPTQIGNGLYKLDFEGTEAYYGMVDGYFAIGLNTPLRSDCQNSFTTVFSGRSFAAVLQTPILGQLINDPAFDYSVKAEMYLNGDETVFQITLPGTEKPILPTIIGDAPTFFQKFQARITGSRQFSSY